METLNLKSGESLHSMMELQKGLMDYYIKIESLPNYPVDITKKTGQRVIKDMARRAIEELSEMFEELNAANTAISQNNRDLAFEFQKQANEEIADFHHFFLELLIFMGFDEPDIDILLHQVLEGNTNSLYKNNSPLENILIQGNFVLQTCNIQKPSYSLCFKNKTKGFLIENPECIAGNALSASVIETIKIVTFDLIHSINMVCHSLNAREHHQSEKDLDKIRITEMVSNMLIQWGIWLAYLELTETSVFKSYKLKNGLNLKRINENY